MQRAGSVRGIGVLALRAFAGACGVCVCVLVCVCVCVLAAPRAVIVVRAVLVLRAAWLRGAWARRRYAIARDGKRVYASGVDGRR